MFPDEQKMTARRGRRALLPHRVPFLEWLQDRGYPPETAMLVSSDLELPLGSSGFDAEVGTGTDVDVDQGAAAMVLWLDYLRDTGRWTGSPADWAGEHQVWVTHARAVDDERPFGWSGEDRISRVAQVHRHRLSVLSGRRPGHPEPLTGTRVGEVAHAVLRAVGPGRSVTPTGALPLRIARAIADDLGVTIPASVRRSADVRSVDALWSELVDGRHVTVVDGRALPAPGRDLADDLALALLLRLQNRVEKSYWCDAPVVVILSRRLIFLLVGRGELYRDALRPAVVTTLQEMSWDPSNVTRAMLREAHAVTEALLDLGFVTTDPDGRLRVDERWAGVVQRFVGIAGI